MIWSVKAEISFFSRRLHPFRGVHRSLCPSYFAFRLRHPCSTSKALRFLGRSPDTASFEDVRRFQLHLAANGAHIPILNHAVAALRFFFRVTLRRSDFIEHTTFIHQPRKLPVVLSPEEVARLLDAAPGSSTRRH